MDSVNNNESVLKFKRNHKGKLIARREHVLHSSSCKNTEMDIAIMELKLKEDKGCLERKNHKIYVHPSTRYVSALFDAVQKDHEKCVELLVSSGAVTTYTYDDNIHDGESDLDIVSVAIYIGSNKTQEYFFNSGLYKQLYHLYHSQANFYLFYAIRGWQEPEEFDVMLKNGVPVDDFQNFDIQLNSYPYYSPSAQAINRMQEQCIKYLLLHGGAVDYKQTGRTDLSPEVKDCLSLIHVFAIVSFDCSEKFLPILNILYELGANLWERNRFSLTPLQVRQDPAMIELELEARDENFGRSYEEQADEDCTRVITEKMIELMSKPLKLTSLCRISILRAMGARYLENIDKLGRLPHEVKLFLEGRDLI